MGLDMYLHRKVYVGNKWRKPNQQLKVIMPEDEENVTFPMGNKGIQQEKISEITEEVGYWRKANAIHQWFVEHVQEDVDDCKDYYVEKEQLEELLKTVNEVLKASELIEGDVTNGYTSKGDGKGMQPNIEKGKIIKDPTVAQKLLPIQEGFFFGGTDYDEYYYKTLIETKKILEEALKLEGSYYYRSSW